MFCTYFSRCYLGHPAWHLLMPVHSFPPHCAYLTPRALGIQCSRTKSTELVGLPPNPPSLIGWKKCKVLDLGGWLLGQSAALLILSRIQTASWALSEVLAKPTDWTMLRWVSDWSLKTHSQMKENVHFKSLQSNPTIMFKLTTSISNIYISMFKQTNQNPPHLPSPQWLPGLFPATAGPAGWRSDRPGPPWPSPKHCSDTGRTRHWRRRCRSSSRTCWRTPDEKWRWGFLLGCFRPI